MMSFLLPRGYTLGYILSLRRMQGLDGNAETDSAVYDMTRFDVSTFDIRTCPHHSTPQQLPQY